MATTRTPTDPGFGGARLETDAWGGAERDAQGHVQYYDEDTGSLHSIRAVVHGDPAQLHSPGAEDALAVRRAIQGEIREQIEGLWR